MNTKPRLFVNGSATWHMQAI